MLFIYSPTYGLCYINYVPCCHVPKCQKNSKLLEWYQNVKKSKNTKMSEKTALQWQQIKPYLFQKYNFNFLWSRARWFRWGIYIWKILKFSNRFRYAVVSRLFCHSRSRFPILVLGRFCHFGTLPCCHSTILWVTKSEGKFTRNFI